jgi:enterochelin esterase-like enzyme
VPFGTRDGRSGVAFDPADATPLWSLPGGWVDYQHPARVEGVGGVISVDVARLRVFDPRSGEVSLEADHRPGARDMAYPLAVPVSRNRLLLAYDDRCALVEIDEEADPPLREVWRSRELKDSYAAPVVHDGAVFGLSGLFLAALDLETGERLWKSREPGARGLTLVGDKLLLLATDGELVVVEASRDGYVEERRLGVLDRGGYTSPTFAAGRIFVRNTSTLAAVKVEQIDPAAAAASAGHSADDERSLGTLGALLARARDSNDPQAVIDAWWPTLDTLPWIDGDRVHFLYRGPASDVALIGDMAPDRNVPLSMLHLDGTDLFHRSFPVPVGGRWQYAFLVDLDAVVTDPGNPAQAAPIALIGGNPRSLGYPEPELESVATFPGWTAPDFLEPVAEPASRLRQLAFESDAVPWKRALTVYLPRAYSDDGERRFPTLYVLGGHDWLQHGRLREALDRLMGTVCEEALAVLVPYHAGSRDRLDSGEYSELVLCDVVPAVESSFRTDGRRAVMGSVADGTVAVVLSLSHPAAFPAFSAQSPEVDVEDLELVGATRPAASPRGYLEWSRYEPRVLDENTDVRASILELEDLLAERGVELDGGEVTAGPGWGSWVARLDRVLAHLLPPAGVRSSPRADPRDAP